MVEHVDEVVEVTVALQEEADDKRLVVGAHGRGTRVGHQAIPRSAG